MTPSTDLTFIFLSPVFSVTYLHLSLCCQKAVSLLPHTKAGGGYRKVHLTGADVFFCYGHLNMGFWHSVLFSLALSLLFSCIFVFTGGTV